MTHLQKLARPSSMKWVSRVSSEECWNPLKILAFGRPGSSFFAARAGYIDEQPILMWVSPISLRSSCLISTLIASRGFSTARSRCSTEEEEEGALAEPSYFSKRSSRSSSEAQNALLEYLHSTRGIHFTDAEHMSKHSPYFLGRLLGKVEKEEDIGTALTRFFRYHPINEFEPFLESIGLKSGELDLLLPRDLMFLSDDEALLENYRVLCNYGIARGRIGKIYRDATEIFRYESGVLGSKLRALEGLGLSKTSVMKIVSSSPIFLIGDPDLEFLTILKWLDDIGIQRDWIGGVLSEKSSYNWHRMLEVLQLFSELGFTKQKTGDLVRCHPDFMLDGSGRTVFSLVGILLKLGQGRMEIFNIFSGFPKIHIGSFVKNLLEGMLFLIEIEMSPEDIENLVVNHAVILGSCSLKKPSSILTYLSIGKRRLCKIIKEDPNQLTKYTLGTKISSLPNSDEDERSLREKTKFLSRLGFIEGSEDMEKALKAFRGKGDELQDRYDFLVKTGFDHDDVANMIRLAPHVLNQKTDVLEAKISFLLDSLGYPLSSLLAFPAYMSYTVGRSKLRFLMYNWLKDRGKASPGLALSSILACSEKAFIKKFVKKHPEGLTVWENFKEALASS